LLTASGLVCLFTGFFVFSLQSITSSTTILVANASYKFITSGFSIFVHGDALGFSVVLGYLISTAGFIVYVLSSEDVRNTN
jgi:drug/metabolite transporter (DMT)-like permease